MAGPRRRDTSSDVACRRDGRHCCDPLNRLKTTLHILVKYNILILMNTDQLSTNAIKVSQVLKQLAHPDRLKVLCCLLESEKTVNDLVDYSNASQSWVSQFLSKMKLSGLVDSRKDGTFVYYRIADPRVQILMQGIYRAYCSETTKPKKKGN